MAITVTIPTVPSAGASWTSWGNAIDQAARELQSNVTNLLTAVASQYVKPGTGIPASDLASAVQSNLTLASTAYQKPSGGITSADLASAVVSALTLASSAYQKPANGITTSDLASSVVTSLGKADSALQTAPVTSVAGRTGAVTLTKSDVGLPNVDNTSDANKPISNATQTALNAKQAVTVLASGATSVPAGSPVGVYFVPAS